MNIALDEVLHFDAITSDPETGAVSDADSTPTWDIFEEDTDTAILSAQNFTKRTSKTGNYRGAATLSAVNGFEVGKWYNVIGNATVNSIAGKAVVMRFRCVAAEAIAGYPKGDVHALKGDAQSATDLKDFADTGYDPSTHKVQGVVLVDTTTANTDMRGTNNAMLAASYTAPDNSGIAAIKAKTDNLPSDPADASVIATSFTNLQSHGDGTWATATGFAVAGDQMDLVNAPNATALAAIFSKVVTTALTESYAANGAAPTLTQAILLIQQSLHQFAISGTTRSVKKLDGTTEAATFTFDSATAPTSTTRAT